MVILCSPYQPLGTSLKVEVKEVFTFCYTKNTIRKIFFQQSAIYFQKNNSQAYISLI